MTIRRRPEAFVVDERVGPAFLDALSPARPAGEAHAAFRLTKTSLTTPEAAARLAKALTIKSGLVARAGLKDKHALTTQVLTAPLHEETQAPKPDAELAGPGWRATFIGWSSRPIEAADIAANRFSIEVTALTRAENAQMNQRASRLRENSSLVFVNYYGDQRFGSARHAQGFAAQRLVKSDYEGALRLLIGTPARKDTGSRRTLTRACAASWGIWKQIVRDTPACAERAAIEVLAGGGSFRDAFAALPHLVQSLCVEAYQSWLWNATVREMIESGIAPDETLRADDDFGVMLFPASASIPAAWRGLEIPLLAPGIKPEGAWARPAVAVLQREGVTPDTLRLPGLRRPVFSSSVRPMFVAAGAFTMEPPRPDEEASPRSPRCLKRTVSFELPRGAFATTLLRALGQ